MLRGATLGRSTPATGGFATQSGKKKLVPRCRAATPVNLASNAVNKLHLLQIPLGGRGLTKTTPTTITKPELQQLRKLAATGSETTRLP